MSADVAYVDTSAFVKTVHAEAESEALVLYLLGWDRFSSSALLHVEAVRTLRRLSVDLARFGEAAARINFLDLTVPILDTAARLDPPALRSLDAIHLASALSLGSDLGVIVTYDQRLAQAAITLGLPVASPT